VAAKPVEKKVVLTTKPPIKRCPGCQKCPKESPLVQLSQKGNDFSFNVEDGYGSNEDVSFAIIPKSMRDSVVSQ